MSSVALIGGDGAGKTSIAKRLEKSCPLPTKYLYMGINPQAGEFSLPTTRLIYTLKKRGYKKEAGNNNAPGDKDISADHLEYSKTARGPIWTVLRLLNRFVEAWYRQTVSVYYQIRGYIVVYDRHPLFDTAPLNKNSKKTMNVRINDLNHWIIRNLFPKPKLSIYLDAPAQLLHARKGESNPNYLDRQRNAYLKQGEKTKNFIHIDATQPLDKVFEEVQQIVMDFHENHGGKE